MIEPIENDWWAEYFDEVYLRIYEPLFPAAETDREVAAIRELIEERNGLRILDVPCGWGRHSVELARSGFQVTGVDGSAYLLAEAGRRAAEAGVPIRLVHSDMRALPFKGEFDAVLCLFSSLGYFGRFGGSAASEGSGYSGDSGNPADSADPADMPASTGTADAAASADPSASPVPADPSASRASADSGDVEALARMRSALVSGGMLLLETAHRDAVAREFAERDWWESAAGDTIWVERSFDPIAGVSHELLRWRDATGAHGEKSHSIRIRAASEWAEILDRAGFRALEWYGDWSLEPFVVESERLIVLCEKP